MNGKAGTCRRMAVPSMLATVALLAAGCAMPAASSRQAASGATSSPQAAFSAASFVETAGTGTVDFHDGERLTPLAATGNAAPGKVTATDTAGRSVTLVDGNTAYGAVVQADIQGYTAGDLAGPVTGGLYSYYNSAYGQIQPDGSVKLTFQGTPVWLFMAPLIHHVNDGLGGPMGASPRPSPTYTGCSYVYIVDAASGSLLTDWQNCTSSSPGVSLEVK
jgi:hypothetical protein